MFFIQCTTVIARRYALTQLDHARALVGEDNNPNVSVDVLL